LWSLHGVCPVRRYACCDPNSGRRSIKLRLTLIGLVRIYIREGIGIRSEVYGLIGLPPPHADVVSFLDTIVREDRESFPSAEWGYPLRGLFSVAGIQGMPIPFLINGDGRGYGDEMTARIITVSGPGDPDGCKEQTL